PSIYRISSSGRCTPPPICCTGKCTIWPTTITGVKRKFSTCPVKSGCVTSTCSLRKSRGTTMQWVERAASSYLTHVVRDGQRPFPYRRRVAELTGRPGIDGKLARPFQLVLPFGLLYRRARPRPETPIDVHPAHRMAIPEELDSAALTHGSASGASAPD